MRAKVQWVNDFTFLGSGESNHYTIFDHSADKGVQKGSTPTELLLQSLCGCTAMDMVSILKKMKEPIRELEVRAEGFREKEYPQVFTEINLKYVVTGDVKRESLDKAITLSQEKYCHISIILKRAGVKINISSEIIAVQQTDRE